MEEPSIASHYSESSLIPALGCILAPAVPLKDVDILLAAYARYTVAGSVNVDFDGFAPERAVGAKIASPGKLIAALDSLRA